MKTIFKLFKETLEESLKNKLLELRRESTIKQKKLMKMQLELKNIEKEISFIKKKENIIEEDIGIISSIEYSNKETITKISNNLNNSKNYNITMKEHLSKHLKTYKKRIQKRDKPPKKNIHFLHFENLSQENIKIIVVLLNNIHLSDNILINKEKLSMFIESDFSYNKMIKKFNENKKLNNIEFKSFDIKPYKLNSNETNKKRMVRNYLINDNINETITNELMKYMKENTIKSMIKKEINFSKNKK